jgi:peptidyl-prolyl cis-trans isomerase C
MKLLIAVGCAVSMAGFVPSARAAVELAKVNGTAITDKDLTNALSGVGEAQRVSILKDSASRKQVVDGLVNQALLLQQAEKEKLDQDAEYKEALAAFRKQFLSNRVLQKNLTTKLTDAAAKKYYEGHKAQYSTDQVHAMHILVSDEKRANDLIAKAKEANVDFQELAEKESKDPSAKNNRGDLGYFTRDRMVPEFTDAAFSGKIGEVIGPVKTSYGYHVIKVIDRKIGKPMEYDEVELRVKNDLRQELINSYLVNLKKTAKVTFSDEGPSAATKTQ